MKTNVRNEDAITSAMGWLDQLREDGYAEPVSETCTANRPRPVARPRATLRPPGRRTRMRPPGRRTP